MRCMTRARTASLGVGDLTAIQLLLGAVLMLCVSLVQGAATTLGMIFKRRSRDWHTETAREALPQATSGNQLQEFNTTPNFGGFHGNISRAQRIPVEAGSAASAPPAALARRTAWVSR